MCLDHLRNSQPRRMRDAFQIRSIVNDRHIDRPCRLQISASGTQRSLEQQGKEARLGTTPGLKFQQEGRKTRSRFEQSDGWMFGDMLEQCLAPGKSRGISRPRKAHEKGMRTIAVDL